MLLFSSGHMVVCLNTFSETADKIMQWSAAFVSPYLSVLQRCDSRCALAQSLVCCAHTMMYRSGREEGYILAA